jgi:hypothetical protein
MGRSFTEFDSAFFVCMRGSGSLQARQTSEHTRMERGVQSQWLALASQGPVDL